jgi:hypothetical protein
MLLVQYADTFAIRGAVAQQSRTTWANPLSAPDWTALSLSHKHLIVLPARQCDAAQTPGGDDVWPWFARLAARGGMTLNSVHAARFSAASDAFNCAELPKRLVRSGPEKDSAYVLGDRLGLMVASRFDRTHYCRRVDGFNLCTFDPPRASRSRLLEMEMLPLYVFGTEFRADQRPPRSMLLDGWDLRLFPAIWTVGKSAIIYLRPVLPPTGEVRLEIKFGAAGALLTRSHPRQRAIVTVDGKPVGRMEFHFGHANHDRVLNIPRSLLHDGRIVEIRFELPDAAAPRDLGINNDGRLLGLYVSSIRLVGTQ